jgi:hypothetical protein
MRGVRLTNTSEGAINLEGGKVIPKGDHLDITEGEDLGRFLLDVRHHYEAGRLSAGEIPEPKAKILPPFSDPPVDLSDLIDEDPPPPAGAPARDPEQ